MSPSYPVCFTLPPTHVHCHITWCLHDHYHPPMTTADGRGWTELTCRAWYVHRGCRYLSKRHQQPTDWRLLSMHWPHLTSLTYTLTTVLSETHVLVLTECAFMVVFAQSKQSAIAIVSDSADYQPIRQYSRPNSSANISEAIVLTEAKNSCHLRESLKLNERITEHHLTDLGKLTADLSKKTWCNRHGCHVNSVILSIYNATQYSSSLSVSVLYLTVYVFSPIT